MPIQITDRLRPGALPYADTDFNPLHRQAYEMSRRRRILSAIAALPGSAEDVVSRHAVVDILSSYLKD